MLKFDPDKIILGCTHYPYLLDILAKYTQKDIFINPAKKFAQLIYDDLKENKLLSDDNKSSQIFYVSESPKQFVTNAKMFYEVPNEPILINLQNKKTCKK